MGTLTITFAGICTHFHNTVAGVPHRVVLPDGSAFQFGMLVVAGAPAVHYFLMPHFATLRVPGQSQRLEIPQVMNSGNIYGGVHIRILGQTGDGMHYGRGYEEHVPALTRYVHHYSPSDEVVQNGRAACYIDLHSATVDKPPDTRLVTATIQTEGPPTLEISPFSTPGPPLTTIALADTADAHVTLHVRNLGIDCDAGFVSFDFLLHYLTARGGVPGEVLEPTPGMVVDGQVRSFLPSELLLAAALLTQLDYPNHFQNPCMPPTGDEDLVQGTIDEVTPACSDSRYP